jgi:hypothetical protein
VFNLDSHFFLYFKSKIYGNIISQHIFECGHVISEKNGGNVTLDNLRPICSSCNKSMGVMNLEEFKSKYFIKLPSKSLSELLFDSN